MVHDHGRAEDITQDVFMSALRRMRATDTEIAFKPWIYEIAKNACIDAFRRSKRAEEISYDADEGGERLHLVSSSPTPDVAVDTRMALDHLRGAFGGLSQAHHQILVMRELEGLSYRQIGERLGMTRPSVESTLFRARRRLTEEYEELVSGERCKRIQEIIAGANGGRLGVRAERKMARHVSYCQPCRRAALAAGFDPASLERRRSVREKIAALLPLPAGLRRWVAGGPGGGDHGALWSAAAHYAEPAGGGWVKAAAAAAVLVIAGVGVGAVAPHGGSAAPESRAHASAPVVHTSPAALRDAADRLAGSPTAASATQRHKPASSATHIKKKKHGGSSASSVHSSTPTPSGSAAAPAGGGSSSPASSSPSRPSGGGDDPVSKATRTVTDTLPTGSGSGTGAPSAPAPQLPTVEVPTVPGAPAPVNDAVGAVNDAASTVTGAVNDTTGAATGAVNDTVGQVTGTVSGAGQAVDDTVNRVTGGGSILGGG
jgi:RNA polymerase sigma factor (sigma-70 family)